MKRLLVAIYIMITLMTPGFCHADPMEDYEDAHNIYIAVGASAAAYNDRIGELAKTYLEQDGWEIDRYAQDQGHAGARFILAKKDFGEGKQTYVLAFVGTETSKDINFDLKVDKVYFAGHSVEDFAVNAATKGVLDTAPKVHRGFHEFLQSGLKAKTIGANGTPLLLTDILLNNKDSKLYLVGHSLGGAAATLAGAGLINMGVRPDQVEVITFGAPAVGNAAFAAQYGSVLKLTRVVISGDPITGIFQTLVGGYKQFGREILWTIRDHSDQHHKITEYMDLVMKNYYEKRQQALLGEIRLPESAARNETDRQVYIAPFKNNISDTLDKDFWYMREALWDEYGRIFPGCIITKAGVSDDWQKTAAASGYRWVIVPEVSVTQLRQERNISHITLSQTVYEVATGSIVETASFSTGTYNLTPLEAFVHDLKGINLKQRTWL